MVLVDTSVLIDYLKDRQNEKTALFQTLLERDIPFGISILSYQEVLQGARDEREYKLLRSYLGSQTLYYPPAKQVFYEKAARMFFDLRRNGVTVRGTIDMLIALTAIENKLALLHNDRDFESLAAALPELRILSAL